MTFFVEGKPIPQGSMNYYGGNFVHAKDKELLSWRKKIQTEARKDFPNTMLSAEVCLVVHFVLLKPKSAKRKYPSVKPDLDKLVRAVNDALEGVVFLNDSQVTDIFATKRYGEREGVTITIFPKLMLEKPWCFTVVTGDVDFNKVTIERSGNA